ncbi:MAG: hypothetical protein JWN28_595 [Candidatus Saccharibacteria bacterium]|nr:hypothetical protein [Candidatus Saccharibacteria bacterium]
MGLGSHPGLSVLHRLRNGETVEIENTGIFVKQIPGELQPDDDYVGARNTVNLLSVDRIEQGWVVPREAGYSFDLGECVKVEIVDC